jgi:hypothetical protein
MRRGVTVPSIERACGCAPGLAMVQRYFAAAADELMLDEMREKMG